MPADGNKTLRELALEVVRIQDACNLSGVVHAFSRAVTVMRQDFGMDTPTCNRHPITILYLDKLNQLAGIQPDSFHEKDYWNKVGNALIECTKLTEG
jgi:hypothetical protein